MKRAIRVYINGEYEFTTNKYRTQKELKKDLRNTKHIVIASLPKDRYLTIYDTDKIHCEYKED